MKQILEIDDDKLISALLDLLKPMKKEDVLSDSQRREILLGIKQLDEGRRVSLKDFLGK
ncbi:hypothetical protein [Algoriphagus chordae]|nr:hypothetical protein [Algoriphagus chordae]